MSPTIQCEILKQIIGTSCYCYNSVTVTHEFYELVQQSLTISLQYRKLERSCVKGHVLMSSVRWSPGCRHVTPLWSTYIGFVTYCEHFPANFIVLLIVHVIQLYYYVIANSLKEKFYPEEPLTTSVSVKLSTVTKCAGHDYQGPLARIPHCA